MGKLVLTGIAEQIVHELEERATRHGRTPEEEAKAILSETLQPRDASWAEVDAIHTRLAATGRTFSDNAELLREDRDR